MGRDAVLLAAQAVLAWLVLLTLETGLLSTLAARISDLVYGSRVEPTMVLDGDVR